MQTGDEDVKDRRKPAGISTGTLHAAPESDAPTPLPPASRLRLRLANE
ncbi:hypothetical protein GCM10010402_42240 [Actinomadura luteofluorescens]